VEKLSPATRWQVRSIANDLLAAAGEDWAQRAVSERQLRGLLTVIGRKAGLGHLLEALAEYVAEHSEFGSTAADLGLNHENQCTQVRYHSRPLLQRSKRLHKYFRIHLSCQKQKEYLF
jgi:hypothetical protein